MCFNLLDKASGLFIYEYDSRKENAADKTPGHKGDRGRVWLTCWERAREHCLVSYVSSLRWQESRIIGGSNQTWSLHDGQSAICQEVLMVWRTAIQTESQSHLFLFSAFKSFFCLTGFSVAADDLWALSFCWQLFPYRLTHIAYCIKGAHTHMQIVTSPTCTCWQHTS